MTWLELLEMLKGLESQEDIMKRPVIAYVADTFSDLALTQNLGDGVLVLIPAMETDGE